MEQDNWKAKMIEIGTSLLNDLRGLIRTRKAELEAMIKEYIDLHETIRGLGYRPTIVEKVQSDEIAQDPGPCFSFKIQTDSGTARWSLLQATVDRILTLGPGPFQVGAVHAIVASEPDRSQNLAAIRQATRGYMAYLLKTGKVERATKRGWYIVVNHPTAPAPAPRENTGPEAYERGQDLFVVSGTVTSEKPERGYGT